MKKALVISIASLLLILVCVLAGIYWAVQGPYTTQVVNHILKKYSHSDVSVYEARFQFPNHLSLKGIEIEGLQRTPILIEQADIWLNSHSLLQEPIVFDSILINGINLQNGLPSLPIFGNIELNQLAITNLDYSDEHVISRGIDIQIEKPRFEQADQLIPFGSIQFSAEQVYWQGEAFNNLLFDMNYKAENSTIYGVSFSWRGADFSGQAEQFPQGWSLINTTIDKFRINLEQWKALKSIDWHPLLSHINYINSVDVLNSTIETPDIKIINSNLSIENIHFSAEILDSNQIDLSEKASIWHQDNGYFSFSAESIQYLNHLWLEPALESYFDNNLISVEELSFEFEQGLIQGKGELTPDSAYLQHLDINGVKWAYAESESLIEADAEFDKSLITSIRHYLSHLNSLSIDKLDINHSQFLQIAHTPKWQVSGLSVDGENLTLIKDGRMGMWDGTANITANNASFKDVLTNQPLISMQSSNGVWSLDEAIIPLEKGLIDAIADYNLVKPSQPWRVKVFSDGLPLSILNSWISFPIKMDALTEFQADLNGLGGDSLMFKHSFSGNLVGSLRDSYITLEEGASEYTSVPFSSSDIAITANRGRITMTPITIKGKELTGKLEGELDLVTVGHDQLDNNSNQLNVEITHHCMSERINLLNGEHKKEDICQGQSQ